ncbi:MAG: chorismate mutase, partial [Marinirhabdus sp.]|nr:chorismate mutase [Marinirhabdus sp.]
KGEDEMAFQSELHAMRSKIDVIDNAIVEMMGKRMKIADSIGSLKEKHNVAILQVKRWNEILGRMILEGENNQLSEEFILKLYKAIHQESINHQKKAFND